MGATLLLGKKAAYYLVAPSSDRLVPSDCKHFAGELCAEDASLGFGSLGESADFLRNITDVYIDL